MTTLTKAVEKTPYRTAPSQTETGMPPGVPYIIGNEAAERFSFYGMRSILIVFMTQYMVMNASSQQHMSDVKAREYFSYFVAAVYFLPIAGALLAEGYWGKYRTIFWLSIVYCFGHFALALNDTFTGLLIGLGLIALGSGGIKPCVSANVGDQFGESNKHLLSKVFGWFYFSINAGSFLSTLLWPILLNNPRFGPKWAFGLPGIAMVIATICFWLGRRKFIHIPPGGPKFLSELFLEGLGIIGTPFIMLYSLFAGKGLAIPKATVVQPFVPLDEKKFHTLPASPAGAVLRDFYRQHGFGAIGRIAVIYIFIAVFWSLWDQSSGGSWTLQCRQMDRFVSWLPWIDIGFKPFHFHAGWGVTLLAEQVQTANPILILLFIPLVNYGLYPLMGKFFTVTPLRKIGIGLGLTGFSYLVIVYIQGMIDAKQTPPISWQFLAYIILTLGEAMVSITGLEFSYTQAPNKMKSAIMAAWLFTVSLGNFFTAKVNSYIQNADGTTKMTDYEYYLFFAILMFVTTAVFAVVASFYRGRTYLQGEAEKAEADIEAVITRMPA